MSGALRFLILMALAIWIGAIAFFSFVAAPVLFQVLGPTRAGEVVTVLLPRYYVLGAGAATVTMLGAAVLGRRWRATAVAAGLGLAVTVWAGWVVTPQAHGARTRLQAAGQDPGTDPEFRRLHAVAMTLNAVALAAGLGALAMASAASRR